MNNSRWGPGEGADCQLGRKQNQETEELSRDRCFVITLIRIFKYFQLWYYRLLSNTK